MRRILNRLCLCAAFVPIIGTLLTDIAAGQPMLRWMFRPGDCFEIITAQDVTITAEVAKDSVRMSHRTVVQIGWEVSAVDSDGQAKIRQKIERLKVQLKLCNALLKLDAAQSHISSHPSGSMLY